MSKSNREVIVVPNVDEVVKKLSILIEETANSSITRDGKFTIGLSGGSLVKFLTQGLPSIKTEWSKWIFFFCDERVVPVDNPDSTFGEYKKTLIGSIPVSEKQFVQISPDLPAKDAAQDYITKMQKFFNPTSLPRFNLLLLGIGEDGHTCSHFPDHPLLSEKDVWVAPITDSPKPPPSRITLTFPVINNSENCIFAIAGKGKATILRDILVDDKPLPANLVNPTSGKVYWIVDEAASALLKK